jgi:DNA polymerase III subunit delta'
LSEDDRREPDQLDGVRPPEHATGVVGHSAALESLAERLEAGRLPSAILLHGPRGIGKATLAFAFARTVLAATGDEDAHRVDEQVAAGSHPNLFVLRKQPKDTGRGYYTVIRVDEIRALREKMRRTRGRAGHRIAIIDAIDDCNPQAANALLKTLEEPPADTLFLCVSHRPGQLLPTIRSRCHALAMRPLPDPEVRAVLAEQHPDGEIDAAVALAEGRPRRGFEALLMTDQTAITGLQKWLTDPSRLPPAVHLALADSLMSDRDTAEARFARDIVMDWMAREAREAAVSADQRRLASANALWDKARAEFADTDEYYLDARQTLIGVLDSIRRHAQTFNADATLTGQR